MAVLRGAMRWGAVMGLVALLGLWVGCAEASDSKEAQGRPIDVTRREPGVTGILEGVG
eukprot:CAMPEP_0173386244 /NCGR_PEP_ID=MMETSP1356-20130122/8850_1 /TAXON_ID=77927 ORGANISM="Hemiselmis virescens, Strain PCC157" /NCGR_SAMPLE_ID=MMETSP1356 /ASSEMBLY_ACC=CAM_ASM_000847 /LENGTH=57 /DNA_ID=CAMNT_0014342407 /DNA_START=144 /DNA_END=313 /DNA_ORIENTATION=+